MRLNAGEKDVLLRLARTAIRDALLGDGSLREELERTQITEALRARCGLFVTLKHKPCAGGRDAPSLRGCVGTLTARGPLVETLVGTARMAALEDPRFPPLTPSELADVRISISVLTPIEPLAQVESLVAGQHGVQLTKGKHRAVFLPQVAAEQGWNVEQLLSNLALKAGLAADGWRGAELATFEAEGFAEG